MYNNQENECEIKVSNLGYIITSISGKIEVSDNLIITDSSYDDNHWLMLDKNFNVKDINLISENREEKQNFTIAKFKVKAVNKENSTGKISFTNVILGDENYEEKEEVVNVTFLNLKYDIKNEWKIMIIIVLILVGVVISSIYLKKMEK